MYIYLRVFKTSCMPFSTSHCRSKHLFICTHLCKIVTKLSSNMQRTVHRWSEMITRRKDVRSKQHLPALTVMKYETFASLVTSILELKLDHTTMFEWQRHTQDSNAVPDFDDLLEFLDLCARAEKNAPREGERRHQAPPPENSPL